MKIKHLTAAITLALISMGINAIGQTGPGGIGTTDGSSTLKLWLKADAGVEEAVSDEAEINDPVEFWLDQSGNGINLENDYGTNPTYETDGSLNYLDFSGGSKYLRASSVITGTTARTMFVVLQPTSLSSANANNCAFALAPNEAAGKGYGLFIEAPSGSTGMGLRVSGNKLMNYTTSTANPTIISSQSGTASDVISSVFYANGSELNTVAAQSANTLNTSTLGVLAGGFSSGADNIPENTYDFNGYLYEVIVYSEDLINVKRNIIANYLANKYSIALTGNDYFSPSDATYANEIRGIGQEADGSVTTNNSSGWYFAFTGGLANGEYLLVGNDNATNNAASLVTDANTTNCGAVNRWNRIWYAEKTGTFDINFSVDFSEAFESGLTPIGNIQNYVLLYRSGTTGDFSIVSSATSISGDRLIFSLADGNFSTGYFTIGTMDQTNSPAQGGTEPSQTLIEGPAGIGNNQGINGEGQIIMWLDANELSYSNGDLVQNWNDKSGNNNNLLQILPTVAPDFKTNAINTDMSSIVFSSASNSKTERLINYPFNEMPSDKITTFTIYKTSDSNDGIISYAISTANSNEYLLYNSSNLSTYITGSARNNNVDMRGGWTVMASAWQSSNGGIKLFDSNTTGYNTTGHRTGDTFGSNGCWAIGGEQDDVDGGYANNQSLDGEIAEMIVYNDYLSDAEIVVVTNYLNLKYGDADLAIAKDGFNNATAGSHIQDFVGIGRESDGAMAARERGGLYLKPDNLSVGAYLFGAHDNATNDVDNIDRTSDFTATSAVAAWNRMYYIEKIGTDDPIVGFSLSEAFDGGKNFAGTAGYILLYRAATTGAYTAVTATASLDGAGKITFEVANADWNNGFYTLGTSNETTAPLNGKDGADFYGWKDDGNWDTNDTWSNQSGVWVVPGITPTTSSTAPIDMVVIKTGKTITVSTNNKNNASLEVKGTLDFGTTTGHSFDEIKGTGRIELEADNFPSGDATRFVKEGYDEGTVVFNGGGFTMTKANEFYNVEINLDASDDVIVLTNDLVINGNLQIVRGILQINDNSATTNLNLTVKGNITVESTGSILTGTGNARHQLNLYGDVTNNGTMKFTNRSSQNTTSEASDGIVDVNFLNSNTNQEVILNGVSNFYRIEIDKGVDKTYIVSIDADDPTHFNLFGWANENHTGDHPYRSVNNNALGLVAGTAKIGSNVVINALSDNGNYDIPERARLWISGGEVYNNGGNSTVPYGTLQISAGVFESQVSSGITTRKTGSIKVDGGTINTSVIRTSVYGDQNVGSYIQTGGTVNLTTVNGTSDYYKFCLTYPQNVFNMSGGTINIMETGPSGGIFINSDPGNYNVTGGTVNCDIVDNRDFIITSKAPFYNLNLTNSAGNTYNHILSAAVNVGSDNLNVAAQPLVVLNDFTIGDNAFFHHYGEDITIGGDFSISRDAQKQTEDATNNYGLYYWANAAGQNKLTFNGTGDSEFYIGYNANPTDGYELHVWDFTIDKTAGKKVTMKGDFYKEAANVDHDWHARIMKINNTLDIISGTLDQGKHSVRLYGPVNLSSTAKCGVYEAGVTHEDALIMFKDADVVITSEEGAEFGNVKMNPANPAANPITLTSNIKIGRIAYYVGLFDLGTYNLKVDYIHRNGTLNEYPVGDVDPATQMFYGAGNASDGGMSRYVPAGTADGTQIVFPLGLLTPSAKETPIVVTLSNVTDDGYIQISTADRELPTADQSAGDALSYYWRVRFEGFDTKPTVTYNFYYDESDLDGSGNEALFVPGKVLDIAPFTRSNENDVTKVDDASNIITFNGSGSGFTLDSANYTAGEPAVFTGAPQVYYSRRADASSTFQNTNWRTNASWSTDGTLKHYGAAASDYPKAGDIAVIGYGNINQPGADADCDCWTHRIDVQGTETMALLIFDSEPSATAKNVRLGRINIGSTETLNADIIRGLGELHVNISGADLGTINTSDLGDFVSDKQSSIIYNLNAAPTPNPFVINQFTEYPTVRFYADGANTSAAKIYRFTFGTDVSAKMFMIDGNAAFEVTNNITIEDTLFLGANKDGELIFNNDGVSNTVSAKEILFESPLFAAANQSENRNKIWVETGGGFGIKHNLKVSGNITMRTGSAQADAGAAFDLYTNASDNNVLLTLDGKTNGEFNNTTNAIPDFYRIVVNKDTAQTNTFTFNDDFVVNGASNGAYVDKAILVSSGTLIFDDPGHDFVLSNGGEDYELPAAAGIEVKQGSLSISGSSLILDGKLTLSGGDFDMSGGDNHIEYSASGSAEIEVSAGTLTVGSQIRGGLMADEGILKYTQTGGTVIVGNDAAPQTGRGVFEIHNTGSAFTFTGGDLQIVRSNGVATRPALYLLPATSSIGSNMTIKLGNASTPANQNFGIQASVAIPNLEIDNSSGQNPIATLWTEALKVQNNINIETGTTLNADGNDLYIGGDMLNDGTYTAGTNTTYLNGSADQTLSGSGNFNFYNLSKTANNVVDISKGILINNDLTISTGTFNDNNFTVTLNGDLDNDGTIVYGGSGNGILMNGSAKQNLSGTGTIGKLTIDNANNVEVLNGNSPVINNELKINNGVFDIGSNLLTLNLGAAVTTDNTFSASRMIQTTKSYVDAGVKKVFAAEINPADSTSILLPMGSNGVYSPVEFRVAENANSTGSITVKASHETHPSVIEDVEDPDPDIVDANNALHFYWVLRSSGMSGFNARMILYANDSLAYVENADGSTYTQADYITARLLNDGSYQWDKFDYSSFNVTNDELSFYFSGTNDIGISGDYTAGIEPNSATKLGAIPDEVPLYTSTGDGNWDDAIWTPVAPAGGPRGSRVLVNHHVTMTGNFTSSYVVEIGATGRLSLEETYGHRLGDIKGTGTLHILSGNLPSGLYDEFIQETGGTLEFGGSTDYTVLSDFTYAHNVLFSGTGTRNLPNENLTFTGDVVINGDDANLHVDNLYDNTHSIKGDLTLTTGTFDAGTGNDATLIFNGTSQQTITGNFTAAVSSDFNNIKIDNAAGVQIVNNIEIASKLTLTNGLITPGAGGSITITNTSEAAITESSSSSYVNGALNKKIADNGNFEFPVGNASQYKPIAIIAGNLTTEANSVWTAQYLGANSITDIKTDATDQLISVTPVDRWNLGCPTSAAGQVKLYWNAHSSVDPTMNLNDMRVAKLDVTPEPDEWYSQGNTATTGNTTSGSVTSNANVSFSYHEFTLGTTSSAPLPVTWLNFYGKANLTNVELTWSTAAEKDNDYFDVERSLDGVEFTTVGRVQGSGNSMVQLSYTFADEYPYTGTAYYRLKQVDFNGEFDYSKTIAVYFEGTQVFDDNSVALYPNPFSDGDLTLELKGIQGNTPISIRVTSLTGHTVYTVKLNAPEHHKVNLIPMAMDRLPQGIYFISISTKDKTLTKRLVVH